MLPSCRMPRPRHSPAPAACGPCICCEPGAAPRLPPGQYPPPQGLHIKSRLGETFSFSLSALTELSSSGMTLGATGKHTAVGRSRKCKPAPQAGMSAAGARVQRGTTGSGAIPCSHASPATSPCSHSGGLSSTLDATQPRMARIRKPGPWAQEGGVQGQRVGRQAGRQAGQRVAGYGTEKWAQDGRKRVRHNLSACCCNHCADCRRAMHSFMPDHDLCGAAPTWKRTPDSRPPERPFFSTPMAKPI